MTHSHQMCCGNLAFSHYLGTSLKILNKMSIMAAETKQRYKLYSSLLAQSGPQNVIMYFILVTTEQEYEAESIQTKRAVCQRQKTK